MLIHIKDNIWYTPCDASTDRPNLGYVCGTHGSIMIDSGTSPAHVEYYRASLEKQGFSMPKMVFVTHHHWDHTFGMATVEKEALTIAGLRTNQKLEELKTYVWDIPHLDAYCADNRFPLFSRPHILIEYPDLKGIQVRTAQLVFDEELRIDLGGETVVMRPITSGHTDECYYLLAEQSKVLFLGDGNSEEVVGEEWIDHPEPLAQEIEELRALDFSVCVTGHVPPYTKKELLENLEERLEKCR